MKFVKSKNLGAAVIVDKMLIPLEKLGFPGSLDDLIVSGEEALDKLKKVLNNSDFEGAVLESEGLDAPLSAPSKIVAIGLNYMDHASESKMEVPDHPLVFTKFTSSITGPTDTIKIPTELTKEVDYEVELGVIIGKEAKNVSKDKALSHVFGYTVLNDVSARNLQFADEQWVRGKSLDTFCPMGPMILTADEIADPQNLEIGCSVNGKTLQLDNTQNMIFSVADLVSILSKSFTLKAGDIIASGTPKGVGFSRKPPIYLTDGDTVKTWIKGIGELVNPVEEV